MSADEVSTEATTTELHLSQQTIRDHVRSLTAKLGPQMRLEAVSTAARGELLALLSSPRRR